MRILASTTILAVGLTLSACNTMTGPHGGVVSVHQPVVSRTDYVFDVNADGEGLAYNETARLDAWFQSLELDYGDRISIDDPNPYGGPARRAAVSDLAARYGILLADGAPVTAGQVYPGTMRVVVSRMTAHVPGCPDWSRESNPDFSNQPMSNFGCGVNSNLAAMVANPEDLIRGQRGDPGGDARTATRAIQAYRNAAPSSAEGLEDIRTSDVGGN